MINQHRFSQELNSFFVDNVWNNNSIQGDVLTGNENFSLKSFAMFDRMNDNFMQEFIQDIVSFRNNDYSFGVILPPNKE